MSDSLTTTARWLLIASFAMWGSAYFPGLLPVPMAQVSDHGLDDPSDRVPAEDAPMSPVNSIPEDSSDKAGSDSIPALARSLAIIHLEEGAYHPVSPSVFYSLHASNELLRPPCV
jgi:hypothetical protein